MAITGAVLISPVGNFAPYMFPDLDDLEDPGAFSDLMDSFASAANTSVAALNLSTSAVADSAALALANHRVYKRILERMLTSPAEMEQSGHSRGAYLAAQMTMVQEEAQRYLNEYEAIVAADSASTEVSSGIPPTTMVNHRVKW